jgi:site-specific DNA recombinase
VTYQGGHEPLVARKVWNCAQDILNGRQKTNPGKTRHEFAYSGIVSCGHCGCSLVGEVKKGRYVYYHCTGYRGNCGEPYTREEILTQQFAVGLRELILFPTVLRWLTTELLQSDESERLARAQARRLGQAELERGQVRLEMMYGLRRDSGNFQGSDSANFFN